MRSRAFRPASIFRTVMVAMTALHAVYALLTLKASRLDVSWALDEYRPDRAADRTRTRALQRERVRACRAVPRRGRVGTAELSGPLQYARRHLSLAGPLLRRGRSVRERAAPEPALHRSRAQSQRDVQ